MGLHACNSLSITFLFFSNEKQMASPFRPLELKKNSALWKVVKLVIKQVNPGKYAVLNGQYDPPCS